MRRDEFIQPLTYFSILAMLALKALTVIIFIFAFLATGLNRFTNYSESNNTGTIPPDSSMIVSNPLPDVTLGLREMIIPTPTQVTLIPTFTNTPQLIPTDTSTPTETATLTATITPTLQPTATSTTAVSPTTSPTATQMATQTPTLAATATQQASGAFSLVASPLQGIPAADLSSIISQSFLLPPTGEDSGHHGVDFAFWQRGDLNSIEGLPILSIFPGRVASAYSKIRTPYGYMVIVETPLSSLPQEVIEAIKLPEESQTPASPSNRLTCPTGFADWWSTDSQSLYVLYGHMQDSPEVVLGQTVKIGDELGKVGSTGSSSAPHLHLEMRIGPSNATFNSMGHYDTTTTDQERHNYCMWRISGEFEMFDPMELYPSSGTESTPSNYPTSSDIPMN